MSAQASAWLHAAAIGMALIAPAWSAAQEQTEPERLYAQLKESEEPGAGPLAERWRVLVRQRIWSDASGKFKVYARYVDHDPNFASVTLLILQKKGDQQSYKEGTIPLAKLGNTEQALVKRIATVRKEVEEKLAGSPTDSAASGEGEAGVDAAGQGYEGRPPLEGREGVPAGEESVAGYEDRQTAPEPEPPLPAAILAEPWRSDFAAFASNLSYTPDEEGKPKVSFGRLAQLQAVYEMEQQLAAIRNLPAGQRPSQAVLVQQAMAYGWARGGIGPVAWQVTLGAPISGPGATIEHDLAAPEPFSVKLIADTAKLDAYRRLTAGSQVRLIGTFRSLGGEGEKPELVLSVRPLTALPPESDAPAAASEIAPRVLEDPVLEVENRGVEDLGSPRQRGK